MKGGGCDGMKGGGGDGREEESVGSTATGDVPSR